MERWECHVLAKLFDRDRLQKDPFIGVFQKLTDLAGRLEIREKFWEDLRVTSCGEEGAVEGGQRLHLQLKESEHRRKELSEKAHDLVSLVYLKEAELQYCHSQVSRFRKEAVSLASRANHLGASLSECEFSLESQSKELTVLRAGLVRASQENEELLERWMEEKREEAKRVNRHNDTQHRWQHFTKRLNKHLYRERSKLAMANSWNTTDLPPSAVQKHSWPGRPNTWSAAATASSPMMEGPHGATDTQPSPAKLTTHRAVTTGSES